MKTLIKVFVVCVFSLLTMRVSMAEVPYMDVFKAMTMEITEETVDKLDRKLLVRVIQLRDFEKFPPKVLSKLSEKIFKEFGPYSKTKITFEFTDMEKNIVINTLTSEELSISEKNINTLIGIRFAQYMRVYQNKTLLQGRPIVQGGADEVIYYVGVYREFLKSVDVEPPPAQKSIDKITEQLKLISSGYSEREKTKMYIFIGLLVKTIAVKQIKVFLEEDSDEGIIQRLINLQQTSDPTKAQVQQPAQRQNTRRVPGRFLNTDSIPEEDDVQ